ncbi:MAG: ABC transporter permease [Bacteroidetes bacterium]|nr:ABC transporter permease [Bacteroidota bacterium]
MNNTQLIFRNLWFFRKSYLAVFTGAVISVAVLTGALIIGDSVRYSLQKLAVTRLGKIRFSMETGDRYFRDSLAYDLASKINGPVVPVLQTEGIPVNPDNDLSINRVQVYGIDQRFRVLWNNSPAAPGEDEALINQNVAEKLGLGTGDEFLLKLPRQGMAPSDAPFVSEKSNSVSIRLKARVLDKKEWVGRFSLKSNQVSPYNIYVSLPQMAAVLSLKGRSNLLLVGSPQGNSFTAGKLDTLLQQVWKPADAGLVISRIANKNIFEITSQRIFLDDRLIRGVATALHGGSFLLTYLANSLSVKNKTTPYSFITAADSIYLKQNLKDNEIIINSWLAEDLDTRPGDSLTMKYFLMGPMRRLKEDSTSFVIRSVISLSDPVSDPSLMPAFPGMSDAGSCRDWETGTVVDLKRIRDKDERYWNDHRGTPKAFISLEKGRKLWANPFGASTALRFPAEGNDIHGIESAFRQQVRPEENGLKFQSVYDEGMSAAAHSTDFGSLFLSLSFFIIISGFLLMAMLFTLHLSSRMKEAALMSAIGFHKRHIISILLAEAGIISMMAGIIGAILGIFYNQFLLFGLTTIWKNAVGTPFLEWHVEITTLIMGGLSGIVLTLAILLLMISRSLKRPLSVILRGSRMADREKKPGKKSVLLVLWLFSIATFLLLVYSLFGRNDPDPTLFLVSGALMMAAGIGWVSYFFLHSGSWAGFSFHGFRALLVKNVGYNLTRMLGVVTLVSLGTFTLVITGANRRTFYGSENDRRSGTGGFLFWAETTIPVEYDLNSQIGKEHFSIQDEEALKRVHFFQMLRFEGNDASCLNLNQITRPALLGVDTRYLDSAAAFTFVTLESRQYKGLC